MARYPDAEWHPSPNFSERGLYEVRLYVEHISGEGTFEGMRSWFKNPDSQVSAHFGIARNGRVDQYVDTTFAAWHAGIVRNPDLHIALIPDVNPNRYSIGIEYEGVPGVPLTEGQIEEAIKLHRWLDKVHPLFKLDHKHIVGHYQINSVDRANDPGPAFPWDRLLAGMKGDDMVFNDDDKTDLANARDVVRGWGAYLSEAAKVKAPLLFKDGPGKELTEAAATLDRILGSLQ